MTKEKTKLEAARYELKVHQEFTEENKEAFKLITKARKKKQELEQEIRRLEWEAYGMKEGDTYFCLQYEGSVYSYKWGFTRNDMAAADRGNVFKTREEAEAEDARRVAAVEAARAKGA